MAFAVSSMSAARQGTQKPAPKGRCPRSGQRRCGGITQDGMLDSVTELPLSPRSAYFFLPWSCGTTTVVVAVALLPGRVPGLVGDRVGSSRPGALPFRAQLEGPVIGAVVGSADVVRRCAAVVARGSRRASPLASDPDHRSLRGYADRLEPVARRPQG